MTIQVDVQRLQSELPQLLHGVETGNTLVICRDQLRIAEIRPIAKSRPLGLPRGKIIIAPNCFDPLPDDILDAFEGKAK